LRYVVITSVTRDDLEDGGAGVFADTILEIRRHITQVLVEVLVPDFQGDARALETVLRAAPDVLNHNVETVQRLYPVVRPQADYHRSLQLLDRTRKFPGSIVRKSGLMLGLGETSDEVDRTLDDLLTAGCQFLTLGQYLQPSKKHLPVVRFIHPDIFEAWRQKALNMGFQEVASGPFVRSSYQAKSLYERMASGKNFGRRIRGGGSKK
jgi:lipoic acid synthetase